ncbi:MAG: hypothetical protein P1U89_23435 [Verrucomicrobiales bacterium]|nr:hypothetical protein [Verrucomicrobiales bacterium]
MNKISIVTRPKSVEDISVGLRNNSLCVSFKELELSGPEGSFKAHGVLLRDGNKFRLEVTPLENEQIPEIEDKGSYDETDWWDARGTTVSNLSLSMSGIFSGALLQGNANQNCETGGSYRTVDLYPQSLKAERTDHLGNEKLLEILKDIDNANKIIEDRETKGIGRIRASIADTKLIFRNKVSTKTDSFPYFENPAENSDFDSLIGEVNGYTFCFRQNGEDISVYMDTDRKFKTEPEENKDAFKALLKGFSFLQGCDARPYWYSFERNGQYDADVFRPNFCGNSGAPRPCAGAYEMVDQDDLALRILTMATTYFMGSGPVPEQIANYLWQLREATCGTTQNIYGAMHQCSILEGISKLILKERDGWSKTKFKKNRNARERFKAVCEKLQIEWEGQFERVVDVWINPRNAMAHGELFAPVVEHSKFDLSKMVGGGIIALILADMGWRAPVNFDILEESHFLYRKISNEPVIRGRSVGHYSNDIPGSWSLRGQMYKSSTEQSDH